MSGLLLTPNLSQSFFLAKFSVRFFNLAPILSKSLIIGGGFSKTSFKSSVRFTASSFLSIGLNFSPFSSRCSRSIISALTSPSYCLRHSKISAVFKRSNSLPNFPCRIILKHVLSSSSFNEGWSSKMLLQQNCNSSSVERVLFASTSFTSLPTSAKIHPRTIAGLCFTAVWIFVPVSQASWGVKVILLSVINEIVESFR